ncbi:uncharacterized protein At5g08430-like isoform X2 [Carica papaya]|uniref:uncharacterized protein At5g08430-like isoform X2 n=1 Tax=Carica papaya TaxID=3649 RepID=UPI000B8CE579|nr:uncharacterized protein At5g08430-like isoform X2 [Carica papaya]
MGNKEEAQNWLWAEDKEEEEEAREWLWAEDYSDLSYAPAVGSKRRARTKRVLEFQGWGSKQLIEFLESIGRDTSTQISRYDVAEILEQYIQVNNLQHPKKKKKRVVCDERLHSLFGKKTLSRIQIYDMLEAHYAENREEWDTDFFSSSDEEQQRKSLVPEKKSYQKRKIEEGSPKSCFASVIPENIKLVYLKKTLVQKLLKEPDTFEAKLVGSFVRIKSDPLDHYQKNSHMLVQVQGLKKTSGTDDILLQVSNFIRDVRISMLSDDDFSEVELEEKARILHEDVTKHWLEAESALLQRRIDQANEKGWRKELYEYLEKKQLLETPAEQSRLLDEIPEVVADDLELEPSPSEPSDNLQEANNGSLTSKPQGPLDWLQ